MKFLAFPLLFLLTACTASPFARVGVEHASGTQSGKSGALCKQIKMQCRAHPGQPAGSGGYYNEWENPDGSVGCSCDMN